MRCAIVRSSVMAKYGRWDAGFYTGQTKALKEELRKAEAGVKRARDRLRRAKARLKQEEKRLQDMIDAGEVRPIS